MKIDDIIKLIQNYTPISKSVLKNCLKKIKNLEHLPDKVIKEIIDEFFMTYHPDQVMLLHLSADIDTILNECKRISNLKTQLTPYEKTLFVDVCLNTKYWTQRLINDFGYKTEQLRKLDKKTQKDTLFALITEYRINHNIMVCGNNYYGQLGLGDNNDRDVPTQIPNIKVKKIACGGYHTVIISISDDVYVCGQNKYGQLGLGDNNNRNVSTLHPFEDIPNIKIKDIACGVHHTVIIDTSDDMYVCGNNYNGQLGLGDNNDRNVFTKILPLQRGASRRDIQIIKAKKVACGAGHTVVIDVSDDIYVCGDNDDGQLGLGDNNDRNVLTRIPNIKAKKVVCGREHTVIINMSNDMYVCGNNILGQLGLKYAFINVLTHVPKIKAKEVACGGYHTVIIDMSDNVRVCGNNNNGQLGLGDKKDRRILRKVPKIKAKEISCGRSHTILIDMFNDVYTCGDNSMGQLGLGDKKKRRVLTLVPNIKAKKVACGEYHTMLLL